jgi:peptide/nickel transport system substrate-binding protein
MGGVGPVMATGVKFRLYQVTLLLSLLAPPLAAQRPLKFLETSVPTLLNPIEGYQTAAGVRLLELVFRGLYTEDASGVWVPELAASMPDTIGTDLVVTIRQDALWPDGRPVTAQDVAFSFEVFTDPDNNNPNREIFELFQSVDALPDGTVRFRLRRQHNSAIARMSFPVMPKHIHLYPFLDPQMQYSHQPVGAGPFEVTNVQQNQIQLKRSQHHYRQQYPVDSVEVVINPTDALHCSLLLAGFVDLDPAALPSCLAQLRANPETSVEPYDSRSWTGFGYNCKRGVLALREVRQALTYMFDRRSALRAAYLNAGRLVSGPFPTSSFARDPMILPRAHDRVQADLLLEGVQVIDSDGDGYRDLNGERVTLTMVLSKDMSQAEKNVCADFVRQLEAGLFHVDVQYLSERNWKRRIFYEHDYDITHVTWKFDEASNILPLFARSEQGPGQYNIVQYDNPLVDKLLQDFRESVDPTIKTAIGRRLHGILNEEVPYTFLWSLEHSAGYRTDRICRLDIDPFYFFRRLHQWRMCD